MKITKRQLKILIESFLKEESKSDLPSTQDAFEEVFPSLKAAKLAGRFANWSIETANVVLDALGRDISLEFKKGSAGEMITIGDREYLIGLKIPKGNLYQVGVIVPENAVESIKSWAKENQITLYKVSKADIKNYWEKGYAKGIERLKGYENSKALEDKSDRIFVMIPGVGGSKNVSRSGGSIETVDRFLKETGFETMGAVSGALAVVAAGVGAAPLAAALEGIGNIINLADIVAKIDTKDFLGAGIGILCLFPAGDAIQVFKKIESLMGKNVDALAEPALELSDFLIGLADGDFLGSVQSTVESKLSGEDIDWGTVFPTIQKALVLFGKELKSKYSGKSN